MKEVCYIKYGLITALTVGIMGFFNISYALSPPTPTPLTFEEQCSQLAGQKILKPNCNVDYGIGIGEPGISPFTGQGQSQPQRTRVQVQEDNTSSNIKIRNPQILYFIEYQPGASWDGNDFVWRCKGPPACPQSNKKQKSLPVYLDYQGPQLQALSRWECKLAPKCTAGHFPLWNLKSYKFHCTRIKCQQGAIPVIINNTSFICEWPPAEPELVPIGDHEGPPGPGDGPPSNSVGSE